MAALEETGRSVMEEMMALFTPPGRETKTKPRKLELHPYYKRPGKGHNHDCCDACGEGGDLICCDSCPASFHFNCHAPPLEEDDIPMGDWICLRCYHREQMKVGVQSVTNVVSVASCKDVEQSNGQPTVTPEIVEAPEKIDSVEHRLDQINVLNQKRGMKVPSKKPCDHPLKSDRDKKLKIYRQKYDVYLKVKPLTNTPFDALIAAAQITNAQSFRLPRELECREAVPFSWKWAEERQEDQVSDRKFCYLCGKSCRSRGIPAINCDFCSLVFHLDCLDPPLCEIPKERWMCPNHVENFLDANFVSSTRLSERIKIWQKYGRTPVDPDTVRLEFFRRVRFGKLYEASKIRRPNLPSRSRLPVPGAIKNIYNLRASDYPIENSTCVVEPHPPGFMGTDQMDWLDAVTLMKDSPVEDDAKPLKSERYKQKVMQVWKETRQRDHDLRAKRAKRVHQNGYSESDTDSISTASECSLNDSDDELLLSRRCRNEIDKYISTYDKADDLSLLHPRVINLLALQKMKEIFPLRSKPNVESQVRARASLIPLNNRVGVLPFHMTYRVLEVGRGSGARCMDLEKFGFCNFISKRHARIFFDQSSRVFELINYSKHGTIVDSVVYTGEEDDVEEKTKSNLEMSSNPGSKFCRCTLSPAEQSGMGCGLGAIVQHGSYLRFGCLEFVFCIGDDNNPPISENETNSPVQDYKIDCDIQSSGGGDAPTPYDDDSKESDENSEVSSDESGTNNLPKDEPSSYKVTLFSEKDSTVIQKDEIISNSDDSCMPSEGIKQSELQASQVITTADEPMDTLSSSVEKTDSPDHNCPENLEGSIDVSKENNKEEKDEFVDFGIADLEKINASEKFEEADKVSAVGKDDAYPKNDQFDMEKESQKESIEEEITDVIDPNHSCQQDIEDVASSADEIKVMESDKEVILDGSARDLEIDNIHEGATTKLPRIVTENEAPNNIERQGNESQDIFIEIPQPSYTDGFPEDIFDD